MANEVTSETVAASPTAVVRGSATFAELPATIGRLFDALYGGLGATTARQTGQNVVLYEGTAEPFPLEVGVQVDGPFEPVGDIVPSTLPAGRVARALHVGPYTDLHQTHMALQDWCRDQGLALAGRYWEIYGDWTDDESKLETEVFYLLL